MKESRSIVASKSKAFALRIIKLYKYLSCEKKEMVLSRQILRSGTSIGANITEALSGISTNDFYAQYMSLSKKVRKPNIGWNCYMRVITSMMNNSHPSMRIV